MTHFDFDDTYEIDARCDISNSHGHTSQHVEYRSHLRERLYFKFDSKLTSPDCQYKATNGDTVVNGGQRWIHIGETTSGKRRAGRAEASIQHIATQGLGDAVIECHCAGDPPFSDLHTGVIRLPLS